MNIRHFLNKSMPKYENSEAYKIALNNIEKCNNMIDLGCGSNPHPKASVAVDKYIEPVHRKFGANKRIDVNEIERKGIKFIEADFECLPFKDKEFDFAYSHHVVEHLDNPSKALNEMMRISRGGNYLSRHYGRIYFWSYLSQMDSNQ